MQFFSNHIKRVLAVMLAAILILSGGAPMTLLEAFVSYAEQIIPDKVEPVLIGSDSNFVVVNDELKDFSSEDEGFLDKLFSFIPKRHNERSAASKSELPKDSYTATISDITGNEEVYQGDNYILGMKFEIELNEVGTTFHKGDMISFTTNVSELFSSDWDAALKDAEIIDEDGNILAYVSLTKNKVSVVFTEYAENEGYNALEGKVPFLVSLTAKDHGATKEEPVNKTLTIGETEKEIKISVVLAK